MKSSEDELMNRIRARLIRNGSGKAIKKIQIKLTESEKHIQSLEAEFEKKRKK